MANAQLSINSFIAGLYSAQLIQELLGSCSPGRDMAILQWIWYFRWGYVSGLCSWQSGLSMSLCSALQSQMAKQFWTGLNALHSLDIEQQVIKTKNKNKQQKNPNYLYRKIFLSQQKKQTEINEGSCFSCSLVTFFSFPGASQFFHQSIFLLKYR